MGMLRLVCCPKERGQRAADWAPMQKRRVGTDAPGVPKGVTLAKTQAGSSRRLGERVSAVRGFPFSMPTNFGKLIADHKRQTGSEEVNGISVCPSQKAKLRVVVLA